MEDIDSKIFNLFENFVRDLSKTFPEIKACLYRNYEKEILHENIKIKDSQKIQDFLKKINENKKLIENKDEKLIQDDIEFLEEISFNRLWSKNISETTKNTIWKYLQTFVIININLTSNQELKDALDSIGKSEKINKKTAKELKTLKKLTEDVQNEEKITDENELETMIEGMMGSDIGNIAKEVASSINIEEMFGDVNENTNPMELFSSIMQPDKIGNIFQNINSIMESKVNNGDINKDDLKKQADTMFGVMSKNSMFNNVIGQMNQGMQAQDLGNNETTNETTNETKNESENETKELTKEEKQRLLRQKIKQQQDNRSKN